MLWEQQGGWCLENLNHENNKITIINENAKALCLSKVAVIPVALRSASPSMTILTRPRTHAHKVVERVGRCGFWVVAQFFWHSFSYWKRMDWLLSRLHFNIYVLYHMAQRRYCIKDNSVLTAKLIYRLSGNFKTTWAYRSALGFFMRILRQILYSSYTAPFINTTNSC